MFCICRLLILRLCRQRCLQRCRQLSQLGTVWCETSLAILNDIANTREETVATSAAYRSVRGRWRRRASGQAGVRECRCSAARSWILICIWIRICA